MDYLSSLNDSQKSAVVTTEGPIIIFAGAGSGKTRVITYRIAYLIKEKRINPAKIMAVTFTNKAAAEMKKRIVDLIGPTGDSVFIKTFHSTCVFILRRYGEYVSIPSNFSIYDSSDQESVIKDILKNMNLDPKKVKPSFISSLISKVKDHEDYLKGVDPSLIISQEVKFNFTNLFNDYQKILRQRNALDFNDLLVETYRLLHTNTEAREKLQNRWQYFMIDEYQDTNSSQYYIAKYLSSNTNNLCVVGDDDQSIYSWRGADIRNILNFENDYPNTKVVKLEYNYRSTEYILSAASSVIKNNVTRKEKEVISYRGHGEYPVFCVCNNEYGEAQFVASTIEQLIHNEKKRYKDFAIFYRTNAQSRVFEDALRRGNMPYKIVGGLRFYDRKEIKDIAAYLKFVANPFDTSALMRIINTPARGIGDKTIEKLRTTAYENQISEWEIIDKEIPIDGKLPKGIISFKKIITGLFSKNAKVGKSISLSSFITDVIDDSGYVLSIKSENSDESKMRMENIEAFMASVYDYESRSDNPCLDEFLQEISLLTSEENPNKNANFDPLNYITMMTVHNAKGLEFPVVFLSGMEEGLFPHFNSVESEQQIEEERRLAYVGITRAMDKLFMSGAECRRTYSGDVFYRDHSRFVDEIPPDNITHYKFDEEYGLEKIDSPDDEPVSFGRNFSASNKQSKTPSFENRQRENVSRQQNYQPKPSFSSPPPVSTPNAKVNSGVITPKGETENAQFKAGDRIMHPKYGYGTVLFTEGRGDNSKITIKFTSGGVKTFVEKYTPLSKA